MSRRVIDIDSGVAMVITDLHGDWDVYRRLRDLFLEGRAAKRFDRFVICGDLIHNESAEEHDSSLDMLLDVMALQADMGEDTVVMLLGNHELPHIYGLTLAKGSIEYTPRFEMALSRLDQRFKGTATRASIRDFLSRLPFFARTKAGVLLTHAGAANDLSSAKHYERLLNLDHQALIQQADAELKRFDILSLRRGYSHFTGQSYDEQVKHYLAVSGPEDARYDELLRVLFLSGQNTDFDLMWNTLFSQNELDVGESAYTRTLKNFLDVFSQTGSHPQRVLVSGHISVKDGFAEVSKQQLRVASFTHAFPRRSARYLVLDCEKPVHTAADLTASLKMVFPDDQLPSVMPIKSA